MASWPGRSRAFIEDHRNIQPTIFNVDEPVIPPALFFAGCRAKREERMQRELVGRRAVLKTISVAAAAGVIAAPQRTAAQQVKWSAGTEAPKLRAPADARGLPSSHLRRQISGRPALDIAARRCIGRG